MAATGIYETLAASGTSGGFLRPGGLRLTSRALSFCLFPPGARILDVGCGVGGTLDYLTSRHRLHAVGLDPSLLLLECSRRLGDHLPLVLAMGEELPFADETWDGVLLECSLSVTKDIDRVLAECSRVLKDVGRLILGDLYLRETNPSIAACAFDPEFPAGIMSREALNAKLRRHGFLVTLWEDQSRALREYVAGLILSGGLDSLIYGSAAQGGNSGCGLPLPLRHIAKVKPGYFLSVARKVAPRGTAISVIRVEGGDANVTDDMLRMVQLAGQGFYCSQILLLMGLEAQGKINPDLIRTMAGLAGGLGFSGDTCGALTGGACLLGLYAGRGIPDEQEDENLNLMISELVDWFSEEYGKPYGGTRCEAILAENPQNRSTRCPAMVFGTLEKVKALLLGYGFDLSEGK